MHNIHIKLVILFSAVSIARSHNLNTNSEIQPNNVALIDDEPYNQTINSDINYDDQLYTEFRMHSNGTVAEKHCVNANIRLSGHKALLHLAAIKGDTQTVLNLLDQYKVPVDAKDAWGRAPLYYAVLNNRVEVARILLQSHASPDSKDAENRPILHLVVDLQAEIDALNMTKLLVQNKVNINITGKFNNTLLHIAIKKGYFLIIKFALEEGADVNAKNINNDTPLRLAKVLQPKRSDISSYLTQKSAKDLGDNVDFLVACYKGNLNLIKYLHEVRAVDVQVKNTNQNGLLRAIGGNGNLEVVKHLVNIGVSIREIETLHSTLVNEAADFDKLDIVKYLIEKGADFKSATNWNSNPLHYAANNNNLEMVKYLLHLGLNAHINDKRTDTGKTPLISSIVNDGDLKVVKYLIKSGAQTNITDKAGRTALTLAKSVNKTDIKQYLEQLPNDSKLQSQIDTNSLFFASAQNNIKLVEQYLNKNISVNVKDEDDGQTPLYRAIYYNGQLDMIKLLHSKGADVKQFDANKSDNLVYLSIVKHKLDIAKYLIENGADVQTGGISGNTPLHGAIDEDSIEMLKYLLDNDAYNNHKNSANQTWFDLLIDGRVHDKLIEYLIFEYRNKQDQTMLHKAAFQGDFVNVKFLLERGAHLNAIDNLKNTPLHSAAETSHLETVKLLTRQICINIAAKNSKGQTPLDVARSSHQNEVADFLSEQMKQLASHSQF